MKFLTENWRTASLHFVLIFKHWLFKVVLPVIWQSNRWSLGSVVCLIHTPCVSSVITFRSLFRAQCQRDWAGHSLTTVSVSHRLGEDIHPQCRIYVPLCGLVWFTKLGRWWPDKFTNRISPATFSKTIVTWFWISLFSVNSNVCYIFCIPSVFAYCLLYWSFCLLTSMGHTNCRCLK